MRMSDWSSDVCSSDLAREGPRVRPRPHEPLATLDGRLWVGSLTSDKAHPAATLYRLDPDGSLTEILHGLTTSNGAAFSPDGVTFYHADTPTHAIRAYDVDMTAGTLAGGPLFHQFEHVNGRPDGGEIGSAHLST